MGHVTVGVAVRDPEALVFGLLLLAGGAWIRLRASTLAVVALATLFADVAFFTGSAAVANLINGEEPLDSAVPSVLLAAALLGFFGCIQAILGPRLRIGRALALGAVVLVVAVGALAGWSSRSRVGVEAGRPHDVAVLMTGTRFKPSRLVVEGGGWLHVTNRDLFWHTFTVRELGIDARIPVGGERRISVPATAGRYEFVCVVPGHELVGMKGTLSIR